MLSYTNETIDQRLVIVRVHRGGAEPNSNIILLPGDTREVDGAAYEVTTYYAPLSAEDEAKLMERVSGIPADAPATIPVVLTGDGNSDAGKNGSGIGLALGVVDDGDSMASGQPPSLDPNGNPGETTPPANVLGGGAQQIPVGEPMTDEQRAAINTPATETSSSEGAPPVDNDHVADGAEQFAAGRMVDEGSPVATETAQPA